MFVKLTKQQQNKLRKGHNVRVKLGTAHYIHLSPEQIKKLHNFTGFTPSTFIFHYVLIQNIYKYVSYDTTLYNDIEYLEYLYDLIFNIYYVFY